MFGDTRTRVLLAVVGQRRPTVRSVAAEVGRSISTTHRQLAKLRADGLVEWDHEKDGTLRAAVEPVFDATISGSQRRANGTGPLDTTAPSTRRDHARG